MARFEIGTAIVTSDPAIVVDAGLAPGRHLFQLVVEDEAGNPSQPDQVVVTVEQRTVPIFTRPTLTTTTTPLRPRARGKTRGSP